MVGAFAGGSISGGAFNPAVGTGPILVNAALGGGSLAHWRLYLVGPFAGGVLAAGVFGIQEGSGGAVGAPQSSVLLHFCDHSAPPGIRS